MQISIGGCFLWEREALQISSGQYRGPDFRSGGGIAGEEFEIELLFLDFCRQLNAADRHGRRLESLEPEHRPDALFYPAVVLLHYIIQVLAGAYLHSIMKRY